MDSYKQLVRMFTEQCIVEKDDHGARAVIKAAKDVPSGSLQNPSDPDAGYCGHKGKGYQMQVMETYSEAQEPAESDYPHQCGSRQRE